MIWSWTWAAPYWTILIRSCHASALALGPSTRKKRLAPSWCRRWLIHSGRMLPARSMAMTRNCVSTQKIAASVSCIGENFAASWATWWGWLIFCRPVIAMGDIHGLSDTPGIW